LKNAAYTKSAWRAKKREDKERMAREKEREALMFAEAEAEAERIKEQIEAELRKRYAEELAAKEEKLYEAARLASLEIARKREEYRKQVKKMLVQQMAEEDSRLLNESYATALMELYEEADRRFDSMQETAKYALWLTNDFHRKEYAKIAKMVEEQRNLSFSGLGMPLSVKTQRKMQDIILRNKIPLKPN
jgi:hypothetical protein